MGGVGAFGKMPSLGDFFRINAVPSFVDPWDAWLQLSLATAQQRLGQRWKDCYMSAPIWRFTLSAGLAGPLTMQGVLMPSVDRVGRMFPLTIASPQPSDVDPSSAYTEAAAFFRALEDIALETLDGTMSRDALKRQLTNVTPPSANEMKKLTSPLIKSQSIWSAELEQGPLMMTCEGLPTATETCGLFDLGDPIWKTSPTLPEAIL
jgi:type VI secretion system protein ImpM